MQTIKQEAIDLITKLPDSVVMEDIMYHLYVLEKVKKGQEAIEQGEYFSIEELTKEVKTWQK
jgi:predicted transcriptional regulator